MLGSANLDAHARNQQASQALYAVCRYVRELDIAEEMEPGRQFLLGLCNLHRRNFYRMSPQRNLDIVRVFLSQKLPPVLERYEEMMQSKRSLMQLSPVEREAVLGAWDDAVKELNREQCLSTREIGSLKGPDDVAREVALGDDWTTAHRRDLILKGISAGTVALAWLYDMDHISKQCIPQLEKNQKMVMHTAMHGGGAAVAHFLVHTFTQGKLDMLENTERMRDGMIGLIGALNDIAPQLAFEAWRQEQEASASR